MFTFYCQMLVHLNTSLVVTRSILCVVCEYRRTIFVLSIISIAPSLHRSIAPTLQLSNYMYPLQLPRYVYPRGTYIYTCIYIYTCVHTCNTTLYPWYLVLAQLSNISFSVSSESKNRELMLCVHTTGVQSHPP